MKPIVPSMKYHAHDWNIVTKSEKEIERMEGLEFLSSSRFMGRCVEYYMCDYKAVKESADYYNSIINNRWFFAVITAKNFQRKIIIISNFYELQDKLIEFKITEQTEGLLIVVINMIQKTERCCAGVVFSDGDRDLRIEILPDSVNTRDLTDGTKSSDSMISMDRTLLTLNIVHEGDGEYIKTKEFKFIVEELIRYCGNKRGYYEFIFGSDQNFKFPNLFFTYYSINSRYGYDRNYLWDEYR